MNSSKQLWALLKGQISAYPVIFVGSLVFITPLIFMSNPYPPLDLLIGGPNLLLVGMFGSIILAPELFAIGMQRNMVGYGTDFLLTRAIDRKVLARAKATFLYCFVLAPAIVMILCSLGHPDLQVSTFSRLVRLQCLSHVPGSTLVSNVAGRPNLVSIPDGRILIAEWHLWTMLAVAAVVQTLVYALYPFKFRRAIFWTLFCVVVFWLLVSLYVPPVAQAVGAGSIGKELFFSFAASQSLYWTLTLVALLGVQLWCERRFTRLEH